MALSFFLVLMVLKELLFPLRIAFCTTSLELDFGTLPISIGEVWLSSAHLKMKVLWIFLFAGADEFAFAGIL